MQPDLSPPRHPPEVHPLMDSVNSVGVLANVLSGQALVTHFLDEAAIAQRVRPYVSRKRQGSDRNKNLT